ncbi:phosphoheptose isomerase [Coraliomargarita sinensis]|uniref:Phosphoheptose isomerase n=1 Tax=Coraliomargarita sinensis TaxID=2174842 RepID=A0A317ZIA1_9BACT|nr:SIS domain-containing protein [Coraliomargarita sinensis]PXA03101.1 phosphoheptose isomerase [Coraliomargarita sinensis]
MTTAEEEYGKLKSTLEAFEAQLPAVETTAELIVQRLQSGHTVFACGNGGSATDSMHLCEELVGRYRGDRRPLPAVSLNTDTSVLTCIANDYGFDEIFSRQVEALVKKGDIVVGFSTSGNSENIFQALRAASAKGATTILLSGGDGGKIKEIADHTVIVPNHNTARIQEIHTFILHTWLEQVEGMDWT